MGMSTIRREQLKIDLNFDHLRTSLISSASGHINGFRSKTLEIQSLLNAIYVGKPQIVTLTPDSQPRYIHILRSRTVGLYIGFGLGYVMKLYKLSGLQNCHGTIF